MTQGDEEIHNSIRIDREPPFRDIGDQRMRRVDPVQHGRAAPPCPSNEADFNLLFFFDRMIHDELKRIPKILEKRVSQFKILKWMGIPGDPLSAGSSF